MLTETVGSVLIWISSFRNNEHAGYAARIMWEVLPGVKEETDVAVMENKFK